MHRRLTVIAGAGAALALAGALAAIGSADSAATHSRQAPPRPRVSTLGVTRSAELVSYCWEYQNADGTGSGQCADGEVGAPARSLRWRSPHRLVVDFRLPVHHVGIEAVRMTDGRQRHVVRPRVAKADSSGRRWVFRLPRRAARDNILLVSATFQQGDVEAELGIHRISSK